MSDKPSLGDRLIDMIMDDTSKINQASRIIILAVVVTLLFLVVSKFLSGMWSF